MKDEFRMERSRRVFPLVLLAAFLVTTAGAACALALGREHTLSKICNVLPGIVTGVLVALTHDFFWTRLSPWKRWGLAVLAGLGLGIGLMAAGAIVGGLVLRAFGVPFA